MRRAELLRHVVSLLGWVEVAGVRDVEPVAVLVVHVRRVEHRLRHRQQRRRRRRVDAAAGAVLRGGVEAAAAARAAGDAARAAVAAAAAAAAGAVAAQVGRRVRVVAAAARVVARHDARDAGARVQSRRRRAALLHSLAAVRRVYCQSHHCFSAPRREFTSVCARCSVSACLAALCATSLFPLPLRFPFALISH